MAAKDAPQDGLAQMMLHHRIEVRLDALEVGHERRVDAGIAQLERQVGAALEEENEILPTIAEELDVHLDQRVQQLGQRVLAADPQVDLGDQFAQKSLDQFADQALLVLEVVVEGPLADVGPVRDLVDPSQIEALLGENGPSRLEEQLARRLGFALLPRSPTLDQRLFPLRFCAYVFV
jgi:hypothetical protein